MRAAGAGALELVLPAGGGGPADPGAAESAGRAVHADAVLRGAADDGLAAGRGLRGQRQAGAAGGGGGAGGGGVAPSAPPPPPRRGVGGPPPSAGGPPPAPPPRGGGRETRPPPA